MDSVREMEIERDCKRLITGYCMTFDAGDYDAFANLFALDAEWHTVGGIMKGRSEIAKSLNSRPKPPLIRHISTNAVVSILSDDSATGLSYATVYKDPTFTGENPGATNLPTVVEYCDSFVRLNEGWRFLRRVIKPVFQAR